MASDTKSRTGAFVGGFIAAALAAGVAYYFYDYQARRQQYFTESRRRQLGVLAEQIEGAINARVSSLQNAVRSAQAPPTSDEKKKADPLEPLRKQLQLAGLVDVSCNSPVPAEPKGGEEGEPPPTPAGAIVTKDIKDAETYLPRETSQLDYSSSTRFGTPTRKRNTNLQICYDYGADKSPDKGSSALDNNRCCASVTIDELITPFLAADGWGAGDVFVAEGSRIVYEMGGTDVRLGSLLEGRPPADNKGATPTAATSASAPGPFPTQDEMKLASIVRDVPMGGEYYKLFTHPLAAGSLDKPWFIGFFINEKKFNSQVSALSFGSLSYVPLLLLIGLLAAPMIKLRTMGRRDRLKANDVRVLAFSVLALAGTVTTFGLALYDHIQLEHVLDDELGAVSKQIQDNVSDELSHAASALELFIRDYAAARADAAARAKDEKTTLSPPEERIFDRCTPVDGAGVPPSFRCPLSCASLDDGARSECLKADTTSGALRSLYPSFNMVLWSNKESGQVEKWSVGGQSTAFLRRNMSNSYRDVKVGRLRRLKDGKGAPLAAAVHFRISTNTGKLQPAITMVGSPGTELEFAL